MEDIFEIKFSFEKNVKERVIDKLSTKQGGDYFVFSYQWQCFAWAAIIGFLRNEPRKLSSPLADKPFSLRTMKNNDGEKVAQALLCMVIARAGTLDIIKDPIEAINLINEYANGGFYHIMKLMESGENSFNDLEKVKQEIFSRNYDILETGMPNVEPESPVTSEEAYNQKEETKEEVEEEPALKKTKSGPKKSHRWSLKEEKDLVSYYQAGMTIDQLAKLFGKNEDAVSEKLAQKGIAL